MYVMLLAPSPPPTHTHKLQAHVGFHHCFYGGLTSLGFFCCCCCCCCQLFFCLFVFFQSRQPSAAFITIVSALESTKYVFAKAQPRSPPRPPSPSRSVIPASLCTVKPLITDPSKGGQPRSVQRTAHMSPIDFTKNRFREADTRLNSEQRTLISPRRKARQTRFIVSHQPLTRFACGRAVIIHYSLLANAICTQRIYGVTAIKVGVSVLGRR